MIKFYQEALSESTKALLNSSAQVLSHIEQLGEYKASDIASHIVGREYSIDSLVSSRETYYGKYEDVPYKAVHVDSKVHRWNLVSTVMENSTLLTISVVFLRDPEVILSSRLKLTNEERKLLRKLREYYHVSEGHNSSWYSGSTVVNIGSKLSELKHHICAVVELPWSFSMKRLLSSSFSIGSIKAEQTLY